MKRRFRTYPDSDDAGDRLIGYRNDGSVSVTQPPALPQPIPGQHGGKYAGYILDMARTDEEFTVRDIELRFGLGHQGASFYETLNAFIAAGVLEKRVSKGNKAILRATRKEPGNGQADCG